MKSKTRLSTDALSDTETSAATDWMYASHEAGTQFTRTTTPHTLNAGTSTSETITVNGVIFPGAGIYQARASWVTSCGGTIAKIRRAFVDRFRLG